MRVTISEQQLRSIFDSVKSSPAFAESAALVAAGGRPVEMLQAMALSPEVLKAFAATGSAIYPGGAVERRVKEVIILESSRRNACQFCTESHVSIVKSMGVKEPLELLDTPAAMTERERLAVEYTRAAQRDSNRIPDELFAQLRSVYTDAEIVEITAMIGLIAMLNMFNNCLQVTYRGEYETAAGTPKA